MYANMQHVNQTKSAHPPLSLKPFCSSNPYPSKFSLASAFAVVVTISNSLSRSSPLALGYTVSRSHTLSSPDHTRSCFVKRFEKA